MISRLPRYYKDKFFNLIERQNMALQSVEYNDQQYWKEIERLSKLYDNPDEVHFFRHEERIRSAHESVISKINERNIF